ncbi:hypothetical protein IU479_27220 [Nocardia abscessus]|uniref:hypothetical protein n=1 Tax=Nocardia abscessus TaxID=120957 RepID=UPI0018940752|nr:hypothetical protein [Nocardia abscessus]MBF6221790.1 hypothetical protein [Nocardia abscessus]
MTELAALRSRSGLSASKVSKWIRQRRHRSVSPATISDWFKLDPRIPRGDEDFALVLECLHTATSLPWPGHAQAHWRRLRAAAYAEPRSAADSEVLAGDQDQGVVKELSDTLSEVAKNDPTPVATERELPLGLLLAEVVDPFALEVHEPITVDRPGEQQPLLPPYVRRSHDAQLAAMIGRALAGESGIGVLLGGSSTGKTRALWEALAPLREQDGWRVWHPRFPTRGQDLNESLSRVTARTVLWLNETQRYLPVSSPEERDRVAAALGRLLADPGCEPVVILGSLWREHYNALCADTVSETRKLLNGKAIIDVPPAFTGVDLEAMRRAAGSDARLALACESAEGGQITQYLAGGPELIDRYRRQVSVPAQAVVEVAMDVLRFGHPNVLPFTLLRDAAAAYIADSVWDGLGENWFELALAETSQDCKGARGPITPIRDRPLPTGSSRMARRQGLPAFGEPVYQLADYLEQYGRSERADLIPPIGFWEAVTYTRPEHQYWLAAAAWNRGLYRDAAQLWKNATGHGHSEAAESLVIHLHALFPDDHRPAAWAAAHTTVDDPLRMSVLFDQFRRVGAEEQVRVLADRAAAHAVLDDPERVALLFERLRAAGADEQVMVLLARNPAAHVVVDDPNWLARFLAVLWALEAHDQIQELLARDPAGHVSLANPTGVVELLDELRAVGAEEQVTVLASRAAAQVALDSSYSLNVLLRGLWQLGAEEQGRVLADRAAAHIALDGAERVATLLGELSTLGAEEQVQVLLSRDPAGYAALAVPTEVAMLLEELSEVGAEEQVSELAERAADHIALDNPAGIAVLLRVMRAVGADEQVGVLAKRAAVHISLDDPYRVVRLLRELQELGAKKQVSELAERAADHIALDNPAGIAVLLRVMRAVGADEQVGVLAKRAAVHISLDDPYRVVRLLRELQELGAKKQVSELAERAADHIALENLERVAALLRGLRIVGADELVGVLSERAAVHVALDNPYQVAVLLGGLRAAGAEESVGVLAERAAVHVALDNPYRVAMLLGTLREVAAEEQVQVLLARDPASHIALNSPEDVAMLLSAMRGVGAEEQVRVLLARDPASHIALNAPEEVATLLDMLRELGAYEQVTAICGRLPAAGMFELFVRSMPEGKEGLRFGREPDASPAKAWSWSDLA